MSRQEKIRPEHFLDEHNAPDLHTIYETNPESKNLLHLTDKAINFRKLATGDVKAEIERHMTSCQKCQVRELKHREENPTQKELPLVKK